MNTRYKELVARYGAEAKCEDLEDKYTHMIDTLAQDMKECLSYVLKKVRDRDSRIATTQKAIDQSEFTNTKEVCFLEFARDYNNDNGFIRNAQASSSEHLEWMMKEICGQLSHDIDWITKNI